MTSRRVLMTCAVAVASCWLCTAPGWAQYVDNSGCVQCHQTAPQPNDFCSVTPAPVWARDDKHRQAFLLLHESDPADPQRGAGKRELVRRILGFDLREAFVDGRYFRMKAGDDAETARRVATVKACLRCHATWPKNADAIDPRTPPVSLDLGVSCQACHGPGEKWDLPHRLVAWRTVVPAAKASLGFADCRSPVAKAQLCASCHVGDVSQDKFVKHEWYAAGHPPLPSFELATFEAQMPAHWKSLRDKGPFTFRDGQPPDDGQFANQFAALERAGVPSEAVNASYKEANFPNSVAKGLDPSADLPRTKDSLVSTAAILETYVQSIGHYASLAAEGKAAWPELALYDCTACHHELRSVLGATSRPRRNHVPGRPPLATWATALLPLAMQQAAGKIESERDTRSRQIRQQLVDLDRALTTRPFGDPALVRDATVPLAASLSELAASAANTSFDEAAARNAMVFLLDPTHYEANDFSTARQAAWMIRGMAIDLGMRGADGLFVSGTNDPLSLTLPSGPDRSVIENLSRWLPAAGRYDPALFREELQRVRRGTGLP